MRSIVKKYGNLLILLMLVQVLTFCGDDLNIYSHSSIPPEAITEKEIPTLRNGMYNAVQNKPTAAGYILFDILGGNLTNNASSNPKNLIDMVLSPLGGVVVGNWNGLFGALYEVNNFISVLERFPVSAKNTVYLGEAHYFRAYIYYSLVTRWGSIPILRKNTNEMVMRDPVDKVWAFIEEDLDNAISRLGTPSNYYYVSKDAALALKARVMLSQNKMTEAADIAESLITNGKYKLDSFEKIFRKKMNTEILFAFENVSNESSINISDLFYSYAHAVKGQYSYRPSPEVMTMFDGTNDQRKAISIDAVSGNNCINKYPSGQAGKDPVIISRIAEMYLISAEAKGRIEGVDRLNELRTFRGLNAIYPGSDAEYLDAILLERRKELLAESFAYYDYVRTGTAEDKLGLLDYQMLLPIPGKELQLNPNLTPNPGY
jgi:hypothetical protein